MRRLLTTIVAAAATLIPVLALAENPNQQMAQQIANHLRQSGQLHQYKIAVKYKDGTAWLQGQVRDAEQARTAMNLALEPEGVERVVNNLFIGQVEPVAPSPARTASITIGVQATAPAPARRVSVTVPAASPKPAGEEASQPAEKPEQSATRTPERPPKPMFAFLEPLRRPTHEASVPVEDPTQDSRAGARRVSASFASAPAQPVANSEPAVAEVAPQPIGPQAMAAPLPQAAAPQRPMPIGMAQRTSLNEPSVGVPGGPLPMYAQGVGGAQAPTRFDVPNMPNHAWPSYASYPNYAAVTYPRQYSATAWPYIGPFYPYPQVPLGWRKVTLQWDDGWWMLDFKDEPGCCWWR